MDATIIKVSTVKSGKTGKCDTKNNQIYSNLSGWISLQHAIYLTGISSIGSSGQTKFDRWIVYSGTVWSVVVVVIVVVVVVSLRRFNIVVAVTLSADETSVVLLLILFFSRNSKNLDRILISMEFTAIFHSLFKKVSLNSFKCFYYISSIN